MEKSARFVALDALRGVAALAVALEHIAYEEQTALAFQSAYLAVDFFFALSGFVLAHAYEPRLIASMPVAEFVRIRLIRLWPLMALGAVIGACVSLYGDAPDGAQLSWALLQHLTLMPNVSADATLFALNVVQWSLFFEIIANVVHGLIARWLTTPLLVAVMMASLAALIWSVELNGSANMGWGAENAIGGLARVGFSYSLGVFLFRLTASAWLRAPATSFLVPFAALALTLAWPGVSDPAVVIARDLIAIVVVFPVVLAFGATAVVPATLTRTALWLGVASYPLYAIHYPLVHMIARDLLGAHEGFLLKAAAWSVAFPALLALAWASARWYDAPLRALLTKITRARVPVAG